MTAKEYGLVDGNGERVYVDNIILMSIERPSQADIYRFMVGKSPYMQFRTVRNIPETGTQPSLTSSPSALESPHSPSPFTHPWFPPVVLHFPNQVVPRILYEKTLSLPRRHLRHLMPAIVGVGSVSLPLLSSTLGIATMEYGAARNDHPHKLINPHHNL